MHQDQDNNFENGTCFFQILYLQLVVTVTDSLITEPT